VIRMTTVTGGTPDSVTLVAERGHRSAEGRQVEPGHLAGEDHLDEVAHLFVTDHRFVTDRHSVAAEGTAARFLPSLSSLLF